MNLEHRINDSTDQARNRHSYLHPIHNYVIDV